MIKTIITENKDYWAVHILTEGEQPDSYYFLLAEDAMRFKDQIDNGRRDTEFLAEQRETDLNRMKDISKQLGIIIQEYNDE